MPKKTSIGVVTSDRMAKTRRVEISRKVRHPLYGKYISKRTICYVHDEDEQSQQGDTVEISESRPLSKKKRWQLVRIVAKSTAVDVTALRAARKAEAEAEQAVKEESGAEPTEEEETPQDQGDGEA